MVNAKKLNSPEQAILLLKQYCQYQERCHSEVMEKIYSIGLTRNQADSLLSQLIEANYLNEERFCYQFAGGKFRIKQWGRLKIKYELQQKKVSPDSIAKALDSIDKNTYQITLHRLAKKKWRTLSADMTITARKKKVKDFLLQKGFESTLIYDLLKRL